MSQPLEPGQTYTLPVVRAAEFGVFLDAGTGQSADDILLHKEQQTGPVKVGEPVEVFLYRDPRGRLTATMRLPKVKQGDLTRLKVEAATKMGIFLDMGTDKGLLLPFAEMKGRPKPGERIWVEVYRDKSGRLAATMEIEGLLNKQSKPATALKRGDQVTGTVFEQTEDGSFLWTEQEHIAFLHKDERTRELRIGDDLTVRVIFIREDGRLNVSMRPVKEEGRVIDADVILNYLQQRESGRMPYADNSPPDVIKDRFGISKAAFKRALGKLIKEGFVEQKEGWTYLKGRE
ncbi:MAG TPA: RNA-binding protein [Firmicutes bacterium]|nr:RNA-binding protein [Bacillota bacterium]